MTAPANRSSVSGFAKLSTQELRQALLDNLDPREDFAQMVEEMFLRTDAEGARSTPRIRSGLTLAHRRPSPSS